VLAEISQPAASSLRVRVPPESYPTTPSRQASARQHLSWASVSLQHMRNRGSTLRELHLPASVRLQGLATLLTAYAPRIRASFVSHRQRSWDSPFGASPPAWYPCIAARMDPPTVDSQLRCRRNGSRSCKPRFLGFDPCRGSILAHVCLARRPMDAPLGFALPGSAPGNLVGISPELLSHASLDPPLTSEPHRRPRVSIGSRLARPSLPQPRSAAGEAERPS